MTDSPVPVVFLPGASGASPDLALFRAGSLDRSPIRAIRYPGWQRYIAGGFTADALIAELLDQIVSFAPHGPICIIGMSIGGHFGYAAALRLEAIGREIVGFCAIDSFMVDSAEPGAGWKLRALSQGLELLRKGKFHEFTRFVRSKFWRALLRLAGDRLPALASRFAAMGMAPKAAALDAISEEELSMRLLLRETAPWVASLDHEPVALKAPSALLRTGLTAGDDPAWLRRCPEIGIYQVPGHHHSLLEPENIDSFRNIFATATGEWRREAAHRKVSASQ